MFILQANKNELLVKHREMITSGSVNVHKAKFYFDECWDGFARTAVFKTVNKSISVILDSENICMIPYEVLEKDKVDLYIGVYGTKGEDIVLPTIWAFATKIVLGVDIGEEPTPPTPDIWEQILDRIPEPMTAEELREILTK